MGDVLALSQEQNTFLGVAARFIRLKPFCQLQRLSENFKILIVS